MKKCRAFTLGELAVLLVCMALLLIVFLPTQSKARQQAKNITCLANLHRIGQIFGAYTADYDGYFTPSWFYDDGSGWSSGETDKVMWMYTTQGYYRDPEILLCAKNTYPDLSPAGGAAADQPGEFSNDELDPWGPTFWMPQLPILGDRYAEFGSAQTGKPVSGYINNDWLGSAGINDYGGNHWERMQAEDASNIPMVLDGGWISGTPDDFTVPPQDPQDKVQFSGDGPLQSMNRFVFSRHRGGTQAVFMDLAARRVGVKELWRLKWHRNWDLDNQAAANPSYPWPEWIEALPE